MFSFESFSMNFNRNNAVENLYQGEVLFVQGAYNFSYAAIWDIFLQKSWDLSDVYFANLVILP